MKIETQRLVLRELVMEDLAALYAILSDPETMRHYPQPFTYEKTKRWIEWNLKNYETLGYGLWAVMLQGEDRLIGDCGITLQKIRGKKEPEIGYHINKFYTGRGYATEAAMACRDYGFEVLKLNKIYSYMKSTNLASQRVAEKNGMRYITDAAAHDTRTKIYAITREEYTNLKKNTPP